MAFVSVPGPRPTGHLKRISGPRPIEKIRGMLSFELRPIPFEIYLLQSKVAPMPRSAQGVPWDTFRWVVGGLLGVIALLVAGGFSWMITDIRGVRQEISDTRMEIADTRVQLVRETAQMRVELTKAIDGVQTQAATTNAKLDDLISELRHH